LDRASRRERIDGVSIAINVIQITALLMFRRDGVQLPVDHPAGTPGWQFDSAVGRRLHVRIPDREADRGNGTHDRPDRARRDGNPKPQLDAAGKPVPFLVAYPEKDEKGVFLSHPNAASVVGVHNWGWAFVQATVAILILVGFESVTSMGGEAKNAKRDVPIAVITSLLVQGAFCYLIEYFAANYFLSTDTR
jgi:APA family basic amino acid/polyamine antiporter